MPRFSTYEEEQQRRSRLGLGLGAVLLGGLALRPVRTGAARLLVGGLESAARHLMPRQGGLRTGLQQLGSEWETLLESRLVNSARQTVGSQRARAILAGAFGEADARAIRDSPLYRQFLFSRASADEFLQTQRMRQMAGRVGSEPLRQTLEAARSAMPTWSDAQGFAGVAQARSAARGLMGQELERRVQSRFSDRLLEAVGLRRVRLGELEGPEWDGLRAQFGPLVGASETLEQLPVGGLFRAGDRTYDLRAVEHLRRKWSGIARDHLQIPLAPGAMGINPLQLFPWLQGRVPGTVQHIGSEALDPQLMARFGSVAGQVGQDFFGLGNRWLQVSDWESGAVQLTDLEGSARSGIWGYLKRRSQDVLAAEAARAAGPPGFWGWWGLGRHAETLGQEHTGGHDIFGRVGSVFSKYGPESHWAPRLFRRVLESPLEELDPEDVRRAAGFLRSGKLSPRAQALLTDRAAELLGPELGDLAQSLESDSGVLEFFHSALARLQNAAPGQRPFHSRDLVQLLRQHAANPEGLLGRFQPAMGPGVFGWNFLGEETPERGLDLMRRAVLDELEERVSRGTERGFLDLISSADLPAKERLEAQAYGQGKLLWRRIESGGPDAPTYLNAAGWLRSEPEARELAERFTRSRTRPWHAFSETESLPLRTGELFSQRAWTPRDALEDYNRRRAAGDSHARAFWDGVVTGKFGRQFGAFFTGNQADVTEATLLLEYFPRRVNQLLEEVALGAPTQDLRSGGSILSSLFLKRIAPAAAAVELYRYADYQADRMGVDGPSDLYADVRGRLGRLRARWSGEKLFGIDRDLLPGLETFLPARSEEEELQHQQSGYEPVRKGRFWSIGSRTPFWGEKVDYFLPSATQVAKSSWQGAENVGLNDREYWAHSYLPLPENFFLGPLGPALWDPYSYERRFAEGPDAERPYLRTGERFDPHTFHGPLANLLLGWTKPQRVLHPEYVPERLGGTASREELRQINESIKAGGDQRGLSLLLGGGGGSGGSGGGPGSSNLGSPGYLTGGSPAYLGSLVEVTPAGHLIPQRAPGDLSEAEFRSLGRSSVQREGWGKRLSQGEIARINRLTKAGLGGMTKLRGTSLGGQVGAFREEDLDLVNWADASVVGARNLEHFMGLYGFFARSLHEPKQEGLRIDSASRAYGFQRRFYDLALGGLGGPLSEAGRRFLPSRQKLDSWNPVRNRMPGWLPGPEHYLDLLHGDPFAAIPRGELRLPGEAYERIHGTKLLQTRASQIGKTTEEIMRGMLHLEEPMSAWLEDIVDLGSDVHRRLQRRWQRMGILLSAERELYNEKYGISGHYDAVLDMDGGPGVVDIKTVSDARFRKARQKPFREHVEQVNFYLRETGLDQGMLLYINRDRPWEVATQSFRYSEGLWRQSLGKVQAARRRIWSMVEDGQLNRGDLYAPLDRFEILADVAPWSENYAQVREYLTGQNREGRLSEAENDRFQAAKKRASQQKRRIEITPDRFRNANLHSESVTVDRILDANTFTVRGSDHPIRLAGVRASNARIEEALGEAPEELTPAEWMFRKYGIGPGSRVRLLTEGDPEREVADDVLATRHAVVFARGRNLNRALLQRGIAVEKETDWSDTGVAARYTPEEIRIGALWERFAHLDSPFHSKFLRVRTAREELERGIVFGKNSGSWTHPIRDYVLPTVESYWSKDPLVGAASLAVFTQWFGKTRPAKLWLAAAGAIVGGAGATLRMAWENSTGATWKPERTTQREELEEYWDTLKFVKYRGLAAIEERLAKQREGVDIQKLARDTHKRGRMKKRRREKLETLKRKLKLRGEDTHEVQEELNQLAESGETLKLGPHGTRALLYREAYRSTLYGINPGETPFLNVIKAMPKYKRELVSQFVESDAPDRRRIFQLLPRAEQRVLGPYLGIDPHDVPHRPELKQYFRDHPLPGPEWEGWKPHVDLEQLRMRAIAGEGLDPLELGLYPVQLEEAERQYHEVPVPTVKGRSRDLQRNLNQILSGRVRNLRIQVDVEPHGGQEDDIHVDLRLRQRREQDLQAALRLHG